MTSLRSIQDMMNDCRGKFETPFYLIDESRLARNMERIGRLKELSGARAVLALKCFSTWSVFDVMKGCLNGTTSSSLFEARLGAEKFGGEVHAYSVAYKEDEFRQVVPLASKIIFNSLSQWRRFQPLTGNVPVGIRVNPGVSHSHFDLADPARRYCRLGVSDRQALAEVAQHFSGGMFHCQCENDDLESFRGILRRIEEGYGDLLKKWSWVSLGGGIYFTLDNYPLEGLAEALKAFARRQDLQVYLEPGEAAITSTGWLVSEVVDVVHNEMPVAVVDSAVETHMLDLLIYQTEAKMDLPLKGPHRTQVAGRTCLAGDIFGTYDFASPPQVGDWLAFADASGYTMVKKNWFNGVAMPAIVVRRLDGSYQRVRQFSYEDYRESLS